MASCLQDEWREPEGAWLRVVVAFPFETHDGPLRLQELKSNKLRYPSGLGRTVRDPSSDIVQRVEPPRPQIGPEPLSPPVGLLS